MRLIDADAMMERNKWSIYDITDLKEMLENEPTAYDIDKVVEELDRARTNNQGLKFELIPFNKVAEIVKQGGVADDVCEWKSGKSNDEWKPSCEPNSTYNVFGVAWFRKCPYCGKKIKVVE